jgi:thiamine-monophosphate kinase
MRPFTSLPTETPANPPLLVRDLGEFGLIRLLQQLSESRRAPRATDAELSIGDDAAAWLATPGARQVVTTDALVRDVHFELRTTSWRDLGWKSLAVNVSDVAAMGAAPRLALVTLGLERDARIPDLLELYGGLLDLAEATGTQLVGGDVVASAVFFVNVTVIGEAAGELLRRDRGQVGDLVAVTGTLGASAGGLRLLQAGQRPGSGSPRLFEAHLRPLPRVAEGAALVAAGLRCGMDVSDGLLGDLTHICERSGVGAVIRTDRVPVEPELSAAFGTEALGLALGGGEDYELLCAGPPALVEHAALSLASLGTPLTIVGELIPPPATDPLVCLVDAAGQRVAVERTSWDHFRD